MKKILLALFTVLIGSILLYFYHDIRLLFIQKINFPWITSDVLTRIFVVVLLTFGLYLFLKLLWEKGKNLLVGGIALVIAFGVSFIEPIYIDDYGMYSDKEIFDLALIDQHFNKTNQKTPLVVCFFTTSCPYCADAAQKFMTNKNAGKQPKTYIFFPSIKEDAERFLNQNNADFDYALISDSTFLKNAGHRFPSVYLVEKGEVSYHWVGSDINYSVLDLMRKKAN